jgi:small subunit ribosomal protein S2
VKLIVSKMADAVVEANQGAEADSYAAEAEAEKVGEADEA